MYNDDQDLGKKMDDKVIMTAQTVFLERLNSDEWQCYLFGNTPKGQGMVYVPTKGQVPNWFIRWMMKICLGCTWVKRKKE